MTIQEVMERVGSRETTLITAFIKDAIHLINSNNEENIATWKTNIVDGQREYPFPANLINVKSISVLDQINSKYKLIQRLVHDNAVIEDNFGKETTYSGRTLEVAAARGLVYFYSWDGGSAANEATAIASLGDSGGDGVDISAGSVIDKFASGSIGSSSFSPSYVGGTVNVVASKSLADMSERALSRHRSS